MKAIHFDWSAVSNVSILGQVTVESAAEKSLVGILENSDATFLTSGPVGGELNEKVLNLIHETLRKSDDKIVLKANTNYTINGAKYTTDGKGRLSTATFENFPVAKGERNSNVTRAIGQLGVDGDVGFHLLGDQFKGSTYYPNVIPANGVSFEEEKSLNLSAYKRLEKLWKTDRKNEKDLQVSMKFAYPPKGNLRPSTIVINIRVGGVMIPTINLINQAGETISQDTLTKLQEAVN